MVPLDKPVLVFVYNADSGLVSTLLDIGHKIVSPQTYSCNLCAITHSTFKMRDEWKQFVAQLNCPVEFLHRDELSERYGLRDISLPAIFPQNRPAFSRASAGGNQRLSLTDGTGTTGAGQVAG